RTTDSFRPRRTFPHGMPEPSASDIQRTRGRCQIRGCRHERPKRLAVAPKENSLAVIPRPPNCQSPNPCCHPIPSLSSSRQPPDAVDWMDSSDTQSLNALDDDEMIRLVSIVVEEFGPALARTQFNDVMLGPFEHIAGLETIPTTTACQCLNSLWSKYQQTTK